MNETAGNIVEYVRAVEELGRVAVGKNGLPVRAALFRGQSDVSYEILPAIARNCGLEFERNVVEAAKHRLPDVFGADLAPLDLLARLQHHGIPTRLLDLTENPLAALYFACKGSKRRDGEVIAFETNDLDVTDYPICQGVADSYRFACDPTTSIANFCEDVLDQPYFISQRRKIGRLKPTEEERARWVWDCCKEPMFVYASCGVRRQTAQSSRYLLFPNRIVAPEENGVSSIDRMQFIQDIRPISKDDHPVIARITIPADKKGELLSSLKRLGVTEATLFPDSVDKVCADLKERHMNAW